jgi:hypothetical protein
MPGTMRLLAVCALVALVLGTGCGSDDQTLVGLEPRFDQKGFGAGGHPEIFRFTDVFDVVVSDECPFAYEIEGQNKIMVQVFETHLVFHNNYQATITNLATGFAIKDKGAWMDILHFDELGDLETVTSIGGFIHVTIPGQGIVYQETGIITFNPFTGEVLFQGGQHDDFDGTAPVSCDLLSGGEV